MPKHQLKGVVVSNKMEKTVVVRVSRVKKHPLYERRYETHKKYKADASGAKYELGDIVIIEETKPISKDKKWRVIRKEGKVLQEEGAEVEESEFMPAKKEAKRTEEENKKDLE